MPGGRQRLLGLTVQLHAPLPEVVIVWVAGTMDQQGGALVAERVGPQLGRTLHVVIDLAGVPTLERGGVDVLLDLHREATARGTQLHITGADHEAVHRLLRRLHEDHLLTLAPTADTVIALLPVPAEPDRPESAGLDNRAAAPSTPEYEGRE